MADYKQAGELVPGDVYIERHRGGKREQTYRVIATRPGNASTVIEVVVQSVARSHAPRETFVFYRGNRVEMADSRGLHFVRLAGED